MGTRADGNEDQRVLGLDLLRAIAVLWVVIAHAEYIIAPFYPHFPRIWLVDAVDLFFVLSGFLIGRIILREIVDDNGTSVFVALRHFWIRRWLRTLPAYYVALAATYLLCVIWPKMAPGASWHYLLFLQNMWKAQPFFMANAWSLSIEEYFYLVFPLVTILCMTLFRKRVRRAYLAAALVLILGTILGRLVIGAVTKGTPEGADLEHWCRMFLPARLDAIAYGALGAIMSVSFPVVWRKMSIPCAAMGGCAVILHAYMPSNYYLNWATTAMFYPMATLLFMPLLTQLRSAPPWFAIPVRHISKISYSMYLVHFPLVLQPIQYLFLPTNATSAVIAYIAYFFLVMLFSYGLYFGVERPGLQWRKKISMRWREQKEPTRMNNTELSENVPFRDRIRGMAGRFTRFVAEYSFSIFGCAALLFAIAIVHYSRSIDFLDDDWGLLTTLPSKWTEVFSHTWLGQVSFAQFYRPITKLTMFVDHYLFGANPAAFHAVNMLLHLVVSALVFAFCRALLPSSSRITALMASVLFLTLTVHQYNLFWVCCRTDTVCTVFYLACLVAFLRYLDRPRILSFLLVLVFSAAAYLSKEMAWSLPGAIGILALQRRALGKRTTWFLLVAGGMVYAGQFILRHHVEGFFLAFSANGIITLPRVRAALVATWELFATYNAPFARLSWLLAVSVVAFALRCGDNRRDTLLILALFAVALIPIIGLVVPWYLYLPSAIACSLICVAVASLRLREFGWLAAISTIAMVAIVHWAALTKLGHSWRADSRAARFELDTAGEAFAGSSGTVLACNVPFPTFKFHLADALVARGYIPTNCNLVVINFVNAGNPKTLNCGVSAAGPSDVNLWCQKPNAMYYFNPNYDMYGLHLRGKNILDLPEGRLDFSDENRFRFSISKNIRWTKLVYFTGSGWKGVFNPAESSVRSATNRQAVSTVRI